MSNDERNEIVKEVAAASGFIKMVCGVGNNAAWLVVLDGYDHARQCRSYRNEVKRLFKMAINEWHEYERHLLHASKNRMFHLEDMEADIRRRYGNISDREYYEFWASLGGPVYEDTKPLLTSLWNKYRLSLNQHGVKDATHVAWVMTAEAALKLAVSMYDIGIERYMKESIMPAYYRRDKLRGATYWKDTLESVFRQFRLTRVEKAWRNALLALAPDTNYPFDEVEEKNISLGLLQLAESWANPSKMFDASLSTVSDFDEVFATKGFQKKAMKDIQSVQNSMLERL